jgi:uncharacterized membrane protein
MTEGQGADGPDGSHGAAPGHHVPLAAEAEAVLSRASLWTRGSRSGLRARAGRLEFDRILFFSDAVFAIAITLLIVGLPGHLGELRTAGFSSARALRQAAPSIAGFWLGFAVIGLFWMGHHSLFRYVTGFDRRLMLMNLLFVGLIAFMPYPTALLSASGASQTAGVVFYAVCTGAAGLVETMMWAYACTARAGLVTDLSRATQRLILLRTARTPAVFVISIPIALAWPSEAAYFWVAIVVVGAAIERFYGQHDPAALPEPTAIPGPAE